MEKIICNLEALLNHPDRYSDQWFEKVRNYIESNPIQGKMELGMSDFRDGLEPMSRDIHYLTGYNAEKNLARVKHETS